MFKISIFLTSILILYNFVDSAPIGDQNCEKVIEQIVQGDILVRRKMPCKNNPRIFNSAINVHQYSDSELWPEGIIPFELDPTLDAHKCLIHTAMIQIMLNTCIRFREKTPEDLQYVHIYQNNEAPYCYGSVGKERDFSVGVVSLPNGCLDIGTVVHELVHVIGFYHHHARSDRDQYLHIYPQNIMPEMWSQFELKHDAQLLTPFDFDSVMLYGGAALSKSKYRLAIRPKNDSIILREVSEKPGLSKFDSLAIRTLYNCSGDYEDLEKNANLIWLLSDLVNSNECAEELVSSIYIHV